MVAKGQPVVWIEKADIAAAPDAIDKERLIRKADNGAIPSESRWKDSDNVLKNGR